MRARCVLRALCWSSWLAACVVINDADEFVIEPLEPAGEAGVAGASATPPRGDDCRLAGIAGECDGAVPLRCTPSGEWRAAGPGCALGCSRGECRECTPGSVECTGAGRTRRRCSDSGRWENAVPCGLDSPLCRNGSCIACFPSQRTCIDGVPQVCGDDAQWHAEPACGGGQRCVLETGECTTCTPGETRSCVNAIGNCAGGAQSCELDAAWSTCSVAPALDSCAVPGDDSDCDGRPNSPSTGPCPTPCTADVACGPASELGECRRGVSACVGGVLTACAGAVWPAMRDCASPLDNDCNGTPDQIDATCACVPNDVPEPCPDSPYSDVGTCRPSVRRCFASGAGTSSAWEACWGGVGPAPRDCTSGADNDCDGTPDDQSPSCECSAGVTRPCSAGSCGGIQTCRISAARDATYWSECAVPGDFTFAAPRPLELAGSGELGGPALFDDGLGLVFAAGSPGDLFFATRPARGAAFSAPRPLGSVNGNAADGSPFVSSSGLLYFDSTRDGGDSDLWLATGAATAWAEPALLASLSGGAGERHPWLSADERWLVFESDRDGGQGLWDLWLAAREGTSFATAVNLAEVNSAASERGAALSRDGLALFFASDRAGGAGGFDLWVATRERLEQPFGEPRNLESVNGGADELDAAFSPDGSELFFASDRDGAQRLYRAERGCE